MIHGSRFSPLIHRPCFHRMMKLRWFYFCLSVLVMVQGADEVIEDSSVLDLDPPSFPPVLPPTATIETVYRNPITQSAEDIPGDPPNILYEPPPTASLNAEASESTASSKKKPFHSPWSRTISSSSRAGGSLRLNRFDSLENPEATSSLPPLEVPYDLFTLAGKDQPMCRTVLQSVLPKREKCAEILRESILKIVHLEDITVLVALGWMTVPLGRFLYEWLPSVLPWYNNAKKFRKTFYYEIVDHIQQMARIAMAVYVVDIVKLAVVACGYSIPGMKAGQTDVPHAFGHILYTMWIANRIRYIKRIVLRRYVNDHPESFGRINLIQRWIDAIVYSATVLAVLHILRVESGVALNNSFLAVGSIGTLAFGLASQGIATQVMNGLLLASSDRIYEGDDVMLGSNGFAGRIVKLGWLETEIRGSDEVTVSIPNADLLKERVSNLSRVRFSQVKQILRLRYEDVDKIPALIDQIKVEIQHACPSVVVDGSRPFRVHWTSMNHDHCEITVDTRHHIKPVGDAYFDNRQNLLTAIYAALKRHNCKLVESPVSIRLP